MRRDATGDQQSCLLLLHAQSLMLNIKGSTSISDRLPPISHPSLSVLESQIILCLLPIILNVPPMVYIRFKMHEEVVQSDSVIFRRSQGSIECKDTRKIFPINITSLIDRYVKKSMNRNVTRRLLNFLQKALKNERFGLHTEIPKLSLSNKSHKSFNTCRIKLFHVPGSRIQKSL